MSPTGYGAAIRLDRRLFRTIFINRRLRPSSELRTIFTVSEFPTMSLSAPRMSLEEMTRASRITDRHLHPHATPLLHFQASQTTSTNHGTEAKVDLARRECCFIY
jgi:hypothetical protein